MTYRERVAIEHPEQIVPHCKGGVWGCPGNYWEGAPYNHELQEFHCDISDEVCTACWDREAPARKVKVVKVRKI